MQTLSNIITQLRSIDVLNSVVASFKETEQDWVYYNLLQLSEGERSDKVKTFRKDAKYYPYSPMTVQLKLNFGTGLGAVTDRVTLYETGAFYGAFFAEIQEDKILTSSTDPKAYLLEFYYGKEIFGVQPDNKKIYVFGPFWGVLRPKLGI